MNRVASLTVGGVFHCFYFIELGCLPFFDGNCICGTFTQAGTQSIAIGLRNKSGFSVDDLDAAEAFYSGVLGLTVTRNEMDMLEVHTRGNQPVMLYPKENQLPK